MELTTYIRIVISVVIVFGTQSAMPDISCAISPSDSIITELNDSADEINTFTINQAYIHRGDWEKPDVLLIVENEEWQDAIDKIATAADKDMTPLYILKDQDDNITSYDADLDEQSSNNISLTFSLDTPWIRDYGPLQLKGSNGSVKWIDFFYSQDRLHDDSVPDQFAQYMGTSLEHGNYFLDGGAVISNGNGLCAITEKSLEDAAVDPLYPEEFQGFKDVLGCKALAVLPALTGESTGHADIIAQFLSPEIVAVARVNQEDSNEIAAELEEVVELLKMTAKKIAQPLKVIRLPLIVEDEYFYSYINGTRLKNTYLIPSFHNVSSVIEHKAINVLQSALPDIELISIPADAIVKKGGAVHCITLGLNLPGTTDKFQYWVKRYLQDLSSGSILFNEPG